MISYSVRLAVGAAAAALALTAGTASAKIVLRYSQWLPIGHFTQKGILHPWFKEVEKATEGRVLIQPTAKGLGAPPRQFQLAIDGIADVAWVTHGYTPGVHPLSEIAELPFVTRSTEANSVAYWRVFKKHLEKGGLQKGVHSMTFFVHPPGHIYNNKHAVSKIEDFDGLKIRSTNYHVTEALKMLGAVPMAAPVTKLRDGLARGVFDGTSFTDEAVYNFRIAKFVKYVTHIPGGLYNTSFSIAMNSDKWKQISAKDQETVMAMAGENLARRIGREWDAQETAAPAKLKADGAVYHTLDGEVLKTFKDKFMFFHQRWVDKANKEGVDGAAALEFFKSEVANYKP